jgi:hypothetical protein
MAENTQSPAVLIHEMSSGFILSQALYAVANSASPTSFATGGRASRNSRLRLELMKEFCTESCEHWQVSACCMRKKGGFSPSHLPGSCFAATIRNRCAMRLSSGVKRTTTRSERLCIAYAPERTPLNACLAHHDSNISSQMKRRMRVFRKG